MEIDLSKDNKLKGSMTTIACPEQCKLGYMTDFHGIYNSESGDLSFERTGSAWDHQQYVGRVIAENLASGTFEQIGSRPGPSYKFVMQRLRGPQP
jgi:hypothetical protein